MRIERLKTSRIMGLGDVDWTFPEGPVLILCDDLRDRQMLGKLLTELFYPTITPPNLKAESGDGFLEVWIAGENTQFYIRQNFIELGHEFVPSSTLLKEMVTGHKVSLPDNLTLGDYLFQINMSAFRQAVVVDWPKNNDCAHLSQLVQNLHQGGDEGLSLIKVRNSLAGAHQRMSEQKGSMVLAKFEYDVLRAEWDVANRQQDDERLQLIDLKKLQENEAILSELIEANLNTQERIALLCQNPDYRELRQLQSQITHLEEQLQSIESTLTTLTSDSNINWAMIETLRGECLEWASLQEQVDRLNVLAQMRADKNSKLNDHLQTCGYEGFRCDEDQHLHRIETERDIAQEALNKHIMIKEELKTTEQIHSEEIAKLFFLADMAGVSEADEVKFALRERHLAQWQSSKIGCTLDRTLRKHFRGTSIGGMMASRLGQYYEHYHTANYEQFTRRLNDFRDQRKRLEKSQSKIVRLKESFSNEDNLRRTVLFCTERLQRAFHAAKVTDFPAWLNGWEDYQKKQQQMALKMNELQHLIEQSKLEANKLQTCTEQLREKLGKWDTLATEREEILSAVFKVASQLRVKDDTEKEIVAYTQRYKELLGDRNMKRLSSVLEPIADLERETRVSEEERLGELSDWQKARVEICKQREAGELLQSRRKIPSLNVLEKKIEQAKLKWMALEDLHRAIVDAEAVLERSCQEWQAKFGNALNHETKWIISKISSTLPQETNYDDRSDVRRDYFAYRMAIAQLSLGSYPNIPLFFSVEDVDVGETFWSDVIEYFHKLSHTRQMIFISTDSKLGEKLMGDGWPCLRWRK